MLMNYKKRYQVWGIKGVGADQRVVEERENECIWLKYTIQNSQRITKNAIEINFRFKDLGLNINAYH